MIGPTRLTAVEALLGGVSALVTPGMLVLLPLMLAFVVGSLRHETVGAPPARQKRDVLVTVFFFSVGFNTLFVVFSLGAVGGGEAVVSANTLAVRLMTAGMVGLWGLRQVFGLRVRIGDDVGRSRLGLDDWPVAALIGLVLGGGLALGAPAVSGPVLGTILGLQMHEGSHHGAGFLMSMYALGLIGAMVALAWTFLPLLRLLARRELLYRKVEVLCGIVLLLGAAALATSGLERLADGIAAAFGALSRLG